MLTSRRYFRLTFLLPLTFPLLAALALSPGFRGWNFLVLVLLGSLTLGGIPYSLFALGVIYWSRGRGLRALRRIIYVSPLIFIVPFIYCVVLLVPFQVLTIGEVRVEWDWVLMCCTLILAFGYFYVLLANVGYYALKHFGLVADEAETYEMPSGAWSNRTKLKRAVAAALALPLLLTPLSFAVRKWRQEDYRGRIADARRIENPSNRDSALFEVVSDQAKAERYEDAKATVSSYVTDKDSGFAVIFGTQVGKAHFDEAEATARLINYPPLRVTTLCDLAEALAKAGEVQKAKSIFSEAAAEAEKGADAKSRDLMRSTVAAAQAEAGFDEDALTTISTLDAANQFDAYKTVATIQGRAGRANPARENFASAIRLANRVEDPSSRAYRLKDIAVSQAEAGLSDDAQATAEMIGIEAYKQDALGSISFAKQRREKPHPQ